MEKNTGSTTKKRKKITLSYLENAGAYYLERFPASETQFRKVMGQKIYKSCQDHPEQQTDACLSLLDQVVQKFSRLGYLNDDLYARSLLYTLEQRGYSRLRIQMTMRNKGLPAELIEKTLPEVDPLHDKKAALRWARKKRCGPFALKEKENAIQKGLAALARSGFSYEIASWVMGLGADEAQELLDTDDWAML